MTDKGNISYLTLDDIYPIGSYVFGQHPRVGTWEEVTGDRAIWLKSSVADGTTISQALPNITGQIGRNGASGFILEGGSGALTLGNTTNYGPAGDITTTARLLYFDASKSSNIYKNGANVQPNAYVMKVYKRTA